LGKQLNFHFNYSSEPVSFVYSGFSGKDLLNGSSLAAGQHVTLKPWDLMIIEKS
jgi:Beta-galactosidase C-terminal domain